VAAAAEIIAAAQEEAPAPAAEALTELVPDLTEPEPVEPVAAEVTPEPVFEEEEEEEVEPFGVIAVPEPPPAERGQIRFAEEILPRAVAAYESKGKKKGKRGQEDLAVMPKAKRSKRPKIHYEGEEDEELEQYEYWKGGGRR
jgi:hypothetical protein